MFQVQVQYHDTLAKNSAERWYLPFSSSRIIVVARKHEIVIFYTEILTGKVVLWCFSQVKRVKNPQFNFSSQNLSLECNFFK